MKHLLSIAVVLLVVVGLWSVLRNGSHKHMSVSLHVAQTRLTQIVFGAVLLAATGLMALQFFGWLLPQYGAAVWAYVLFGLVVACFVVVALVPHLEKTWRGPVHNLAAWGLVYLVSLVLLTMFSWPLDVGAR